MASKLFKKVDLVVDTRAEQLEKELFEQFQELHSLNYMDILAVEKELLKQQELKVSLMEKPNPRPPIPVFSPSGVSKCKRELYYKITGEKPKEVRYPYQRRWTQNSTAVHERIQRNLLEMEHLLKNPAFKVRRLANGLPAWEENIKRHLCFIVDGQAFAILGMCDGILEHSTGLLGFEVKTKSTTIAAVGNYLMKGVKDEHKGQAVAYSLLFGVKEFMFLYESVAKDGWSKGEAAKVDFRVFYHKVTSEEQENLLAKLADVVKATKNKELPAKEEDKCLFCQYKHLCSDGELIVTT